MREFIMSGDQLDDGSLCINFDMQDDNGICSTGGYVLVRQEDEGFVTSIFDGQGNLVNEHVMPYHVAYNGDEEHV
jgi:hypothetical protein